MKNHQKSVDFRYYFLKSVDFQDEKMTTFVENHDGKNDNFLMAFMMEKWQFFDGFHDGKIHPRGPRQKMQ